MRKALMPLVASLALCGGVTGLLIANSAQAQQAVAGLLVTSAVQPGQTQKPVMLAMAQQDKLADDDTAAPPMEGGPDMMMDRGMHRVRFCKDLYAHKVGELAFLETKLALTPAQAPAFAHWKKVSLDIAQSHEASCTTRPARTSGKRPTLLDRLTMEETMLKTRLSDIQAERPALETLYAALTPEQQAEMGRGGLHPMMRRMMGAMIERRGPTDRAPDGGPLPPPPPAQ